MSYTIYFKNYEVLISQNELLNFVSSINIQDILSIWKAHNYKNITNLCLYDYEFHDTIYISNYTILSEIYGINAINNLDIQLLNYLQKK